MSVPSSKMTYTNDTPKFENARTTFERGTLNMAVLNG